MTSYIITNDGKELVSILSEILPSGMSINCAYSTSDDTNDANRKKNLVNPFICKISNAKKWDKVPSSDGYGFAVEINPGEYWLV